MSHQNREFKVWPNMAAACKPELAWLLANHERWVWAVKRRRPPSGRPILVWPDGRCRIEFGGTFASIEKAWATVRYDLERLDAAKGGGA